ncbi:hypothetical protein G6F44_013722 [Rhizopus delemar]|nr:hypothetical protein G6F44_013722 [Rhizopus delemar]
MSRRVATPISVPSNAPKRARVSMSIAGSSSTVVPASVPASVVPVPAPASASAPVSASALAPAPASASVPVAGFSSFTTPRLESSVGAEAIRAASGFAPDIMAAQIQQLTQLLQQQQQQQQQRASEAEVDQAKKECSVSLEQIYQISNCNLIPIFYTFLCDVELFSRILP